MKDRSTVAVLIPEGTREACFSPDDWQKLRERNEALDTRVYARAAAWIAGLDRWPEARWAEAEREVSVATVLSPRARRAAGSPGSPESWVGRRRGWLEGR